MTLLCNMLTQEVIQFILHQFPKLGQDHGHFSTMRAYLELLVVLYALRSD